MAEGKGREPVRLELGNLLEENIGFAGGLTEQDFAGLAEVGGAVHRDLLQRREKGALPFYNLPYQDVTELVGYADEVLSGDCERLLVLGIGGSALGARAIQGALTPRFGPAFSEKHGRPFLDVIVADNVDPDGFRQILDRCDPEKTTVNVVSKSGTTGETMSQFLTVKALFEKRLGEKPARERFVFTTDKEKGVLRGIAAKEGIRAFTIPDGVGGRYSVLTPVGLLPAALMGVDLKALLAGAAAMDERCSREKVLENPGYAYGAALYLMYSMKKRNVAVMMPYVDRLRLLADWFAQLWAESLGKKLSLTGRTVHTGQTPVAALGATDQHSQLQLYLEGPLDKVVTFLTVDDYGAEVEIPKTYQEIDALAYLGGGRFGDLLKAEARATRLALTLNGRPNMTVSLPRADAYSLGELFHMFEVATLFAGGLLDVDPTDQPAVEEGKHYTYGLLGRKGFEEKKKLVEEEEGRRRRLTV